MRNVDQTLLEQLDITEHEIEKRKELLRFDKQDAEYLKNCRHLITPDIDQLVTTFYKKQIEFDEVALLIGDAETLQRLHKTMRTYVLDLFEGDYGLEYVKNRLRIGLVHKRIGVTPKLYLSATSVLAGIIQDHLTGKLTDGRIVDRTIRALHKLLYFDTEFIFDTYVGGMLSELEIAHAKLEAYAHDLEAMVCERTRELAEQARRDPLTGLYNRRAFHEFLKRDLSMAKRHRTPLCLAYFDINHFKRMNDTLGHQHGDDVLRFVGAVLQKVCRESDIPCRYGGDEFCIILPKSTELQARRVCERISAELSTQNPSIGISYGVAQTGPGEIDDLDMLLNRADRLMYKSKRLARASDSTRIELPEGDFDFSDPPGYTEFIRD